MRWFPLSATNKFPLLSSAIPLGLLNDALELIPSVEPWPPFPAYVETFPAESIFLILLFPESETKISPVLFTAIPDGLSNLDIFMIQS